MLDLDTILREKLAEVSPRAVLDVACGKGEFLFTIIKLSRASKYSVEEAVGIDVNKDALSEAQLRASEENGKKAVEKAGRETALRFVQMDGNDIQFDDNRFDLVSISNGLHHMASPHFVLEEMLRVLRPGGSCIIAEMYRDNLNPAQALYNARHSIRCKIDKALGKNHNQSFRREDLVDMAKSLPLFDLEFFDVRKNSEAPSEESFRKALGAMMEEASKTDIEEELQREITALLEELDSTGVSFPPSILIIGKKP